MHPYSKLPARSFWKKFVSDSPWFALQLNDEPKFRLHVDATARFSAGLTKAWMIPACSGWITWYPRGLSIFAKTCE